MQFVAFLESNLCINELKVTVIVLIFKKRQYHSLTKEVFGSKHWSGQRRINGIGLAGPAKCISSILKVIPWNYFKLQLNEEGLNTHYSHPFIHIFL